MCVAVVTNDEKRGNLCAEVDFTVKLVSDSYVHFVNFKQPLLQFMSVFFD